MREKTQGENHKERENQEKNKKVLVKCRIETKKKVLEEVVMGLHQKEPESMLGEKSCVE